MLPPWVRFLALLRKSNPCLEEGMLSLKFLSVQRILQARHCGESAKGCQSTNLSAMPRCSITTLTDAFCFPVYNVPYTGTNTHNVTHHVNYLNPLDVQKADRAPNKMQIKCNSTVQATLL